MQTVAAALLTLIVATRAFAADAPSVYKTAIIDGQNNHDWRSTTPMIKTALEKTGRFQVAVLTSPPTADAAAWKDFHPRFSDYDLIVSNFTDFGAKPAPAAFLDDLTKHVGDGGGIVIVHAATSGMDNHAEFVRMVGMGWRDGDRLYLDNDGQTIRQPKGQGPATAHGRPFRWTVTTWAKDHPICAGLPRTWVHETDELWAAPRGPAQEVEILATAVAPETKQDGQNEPVLWTVRYGKGRVFVTLMGHDANAMKCVGFQTTLARGAEWAVSGKVTQLIPKEFPSAD
jgi:type 1 glutamine amidotransferase